MRTISSTKNQVISPQLENNKKDFINKKTFFKNLQYANQASVNSPTLVKQPTEQIKKTPSENFVSSLDIGNLLPNTQPTNKLFIPKHNIIFGTKKNKNIDIRSIDFKASLDFFKNIHGSQDQSLVSHYPHLFKNSIKIEKNFTPVEDNSISHKTQEDLPMQTSKKNNVETSTFVDFHLNRSAGALSNFKYKIKSIHEKSIRKFGDVFKTNKKEELCVKFENGKAKIIDKANIARQDLMKQHEKTKEVNKELFQDHNQLNNIETLNSTEKSPEKNKECGNIFNKMESAISTLEDHFNESTTNKQLAWDNDGIDWYKAQDESLNTESSELVKQAYSQDIIDDATRIINKSDSDIISENAKTIFNEFFSDNHQNSSINFYSSNESINSNLSGYVSENSVDSGYSSENKKKETVVNLTTSENHTKSKITDNLDRKEKSIIRKKKPNIKIRHTEKSKARKQFISNGYKLSQSKEEQTIIPKNKIPKAKSLEYTLQDPQKTLEDIKNLMTEIVKEEAHISHLQSELSLLDNK
ncbi:hypothetical protein K6N86_001295 [Providencia rettgeri]|nr:hypothetical protein [Providencia rettgeri]